MKKNHVKLLIGAVALISSFWLMGCDPDSKEPQETAYSIKTVAEPEGGGTFTVSPQSGPSGTEATIAISSGGGYYLDEVLVDGVSKGQANPVTVILLDKDVAVTAKFKELPPDNYKVTLTQPVGGTISLSIDDIAGKEYGPVGSTVTLSNQPASGYGFKNYTVDGEAINIKTFTLEKHVTVSGVFEKLADKSLAELLAAGKNALKDGDAAVAINAYESAYAKDHDNAEALVYSSLGKLASIAWSDEVGSFFKDRLGLKYYPNTLDALVNPNAWFAYYPDQEGSDASFQPPLNVPDWLIEKTPYKDSLVASGNEMVASSTTWPLILIANLIDKNSTGLNPALDGFINAVFNNSNFKAAEERIASLKAKDPVKLDADIAGDLGLSEFFGDADVYVGWAELELLLSALKLVKATLLYVDSYNWSYDIGFVKDLPWDESILDGQQIDAIANNLNKALPLRTGFMTARGGAYLEDSRKTYVAALDGIISVYEYYISDASKLPPAYKETLKEYESYKETAKQIKDAIDKQETFTLEISDVENFTINFGKFFTPGQFALDRFIETEGSGNTKSPVFYGLNEGTPVKINALEEFGPYETIGFKISADPLAEIVGYDPEELLQGSGLVDENGYLVLDPMSAMIAWAVYHWDDKISEQIKELLSNSDDSILTDEALP